MSNILSTSPETRASVERLLADLCAEHGITPAPRLEWSKRMRRLLGRAYVHRRLIRLSAWLDDHQAHATLRHELAHIVVGPSPPPPARSAMARLGRQARSRRAHHVAPPAGARLRAPGHAVLHGPRMPRLRLAPGASARPARLVLQSVRASSGDARESGAGRSRRDDRVGDGPNNRRIARRNRRNRLNCPS